MKRTVQIILGTDNSFQELEHQVRAGKIKSIGLSNFNETQILRIWKIAQIKPTYLQVSISLKSM